MSSGYPGQVNRPGQPSTAARNLTTTQLTNFEAKPIGPAAVPAKNARRDDEPISTKLGRLFEECLDISWEVNPAEFGHGAFKDFTVEMVLDRSNPAAPDDGSLKPAKDAIVKRVACGSNEQKMCIQNMPGARKFLVAVVGTTREGRKVRSSWTRTSTLSARDRNTDIGMLDPMGKVRMNCQHCPCPAYVPLAWDMNSKDTMRCRRCGCSYMDHMLVEVADILKAREAKAVRTLRKESVTPLPNEALEWDDRECALWFLSAGAFHPRQTAGEGRPPVPAGAETKAGGHDGLVGRKGRVSVVTPTTEARHRFHELLWHCFEAQNWDDKELVVVETYHDTYSSFFAELAQKDPRLVYVKFQTQRGNDWSIGLKRNIGAHLATGEIIANFDDDDLYAPTYVSTMTDVLVSKKAQAVTLSSWYIYDTTSNKWSFCDPIAWGLTQGFDENAKDVRCWSYGYGFSYVFRRKAGLDLCYDDINLGEDFSFMTDLQNRKGERSVVLFHDDFGICLHVQHGGNTSNSIPLREVPREEALDLNVVEIIPSMAHIVWRDGPFRNAHGMLVEDVVPPNARHRTVVANMPDDTQVSIECTISATIAEFLGLLAEKVGIPCGSLRVHRVPPRGQAFEHERDASAADVLGIAFLAERPGARENLHPDTVAGKQWRKLLERAKCPMESQDRIGLRSTELWLLPPEDNFDEEEDAEENYTEDYITVSATCQKSTVKQFFSSISNCKVRLPRGATVGKMREVLGASLPPTAKVISESPGRGPVVLQDSDVAPEEVKFTEFKGKYGFYMEFSWRQCRTALKMMKAFFRREEIQQRLDDFERHAAGKDIEYRGELIRLLVQEMYPEIWQRFDAPEGDVNPQVVLQALSAQVAGDPELSELWLEAECLMRNKVNIIPAWTAVAAHRAARGLPPPAQPAC